MASLRKGSAGTPTAFTVATTLPISRIINLLPTTRPLAIHRSGRQHRWAVLKLTNPGVSHKPAPASSAFKPTVTAIETEHDIVVCAGTHSALRTTHVVGGVSPRSAGRGACDGGGAVEAGHWGCIVLCLTIRVIVWTCSRGLGVTRGKNGGWITGSLARQEASHVAI
jgi:hypothetical protein